MGLRGTSSPHAPREESLCFADRSDYLARLPLMECLGERSMAMSSLFSGRRMILVFAFITGIAVSLAVTQPAMADIIVPKPKPQPRPPKPQPPLPKPSPESEPEEEAQRSVQIAMAGVSGRFLLLFSLGLWFARKTTAKSGNPPVEGQRRRISVTWRRPKSPGHFRMRSAFHSPCPARGSFSLRAALFGDI